MSEKTWQRNTSGIAAHARLRKEHKQESVDDAITALLREHTPISFHAVAQAAGVSKAYLYSQPDLRERIEVLRQQTEQQARQEPRAHGTGKSAASRDLVILAKDRRIKELETEIQRLKQQLKGALAKAYNQL
jgi:Family of unknown function (DUF6262)